MWEQRYDWTTEKIICKRIIGPDGMHLYQSLSFTATFAACHIPGKIVSDVPILLMKLADWKIKWCIITLSGEEKSIAFTVCKKLIS